MKGQAVVGKQCQSKLWFYTLGLVSHQRLLLGSNSPQNAHWFWSTISWCPFLYHQKISDQKISLSLCVWWNHQSESPEGPSLGRSSVPPPVKGVVNVCCSRAKRRIHPVKSIHAEKCIAGEKDVLGGIVSELL